MRIATLTYLNTSLTGIQSNQTAIARLNQQVATGLTLQASKDDPVTAVKAMELSNRIAVRTQYAENQAKAEFDLNYENVVLESMGTALNQARGLFLSISPSQATAVSSGYSEQLKGVFNHVLDLANTRNTSGDYIFGGTATNLKPFANPSLSAVPATVEPTTFDGALVSAIPTVLSATRQIEIGIGQRVQVTDSLTGVLSFTNAEAGVDIVDAADPLFVPATGRHDLLQNLAHAIVNLANGTVTEANLKSYIDMVDTAAAKIGLIEQRVAGSLTEVKELRASSQAVMLIEKNALSDMTQVDKAAAIVELQSRQTSLEAISRAYSLTSGLSLFNYIS